MCETITVPVFLSISLLVDPTFCLNHTLGEKKLGDHSDIKCQSPSGNE